MITVDELARLIKEKAIIYNTDYFDVKEIQLGKGDYVEANGTLHTICYKAGYNYFYNEKLFRNKEDAEFVIKYHTQKTFYFKPPTFDEFIATGTENRFPYWSCGDIDIVMEQENNESGLNHCNNIIYVTYDYDDYGKNKEFRYEYDEYVDTRKEAYYKALDYAKKLFLEG